MQLPFSESAFLDAFAAYNRTLWPVAVALWTATLVAAIQLARGKVAASTLAALLVVHWAWSGIAYHAVFFTRINPAAWSFAGLFLVQAAAIAWFGLVRRRFRFDMGRAPRHYVGGVFVVAALMYPALVLAAGHHLPRAPTFGLPCPTTLFTAGMLLAAAPPVPRSVVVVPILWSVIGGSAALVLSVTPDLLLFAAGAAMLAYAVAPAMLARSGSGSSGPGAGGRARVA